jgi:hypothetical protein
MYLYQGACGAKPAFRAYVELLLHHCDLLLERAEERIVARTHVAGPRPQTCVRQLVAVRRDAFELRAQRVAQRACRCRSRTQLACACEAVRVAQACLTRGVALELRNVAHGDLLSARDGPQRADFGREHLFVPSEKRIRSTAVVVTRQVLFIYYFRDGIWKYLWLIREIIAPVPPYGASCPGSAPIPQLFVRSTPMILSS